MGAEEIISFLDLFRLVRIGGGNLSFSILLKINPQRLMDEDLYITIY